MRKGILVFPISLEIKCPSVDQKAGSFDPYRADTVRELIDILPVRHLDPVQVSL
jgi:hypothetical protein